MPNDANETRQIPIRFEWKAVNKKHDIKTPDWFWSLGIIAFAIFIGSVITGNVLFGILILLAAITIGLYANKTPEEVKYEITVRGVKINGKLYPYKDLKSFWIYEAPYEEKAVLLIDSQMPIVPHLIIPLPDSVDADELQDFLLDYLPEEELREPTSHKLARLLGF